MRTPFVLVGMFVFACASVAAAQAPQSTGIPALSEVRVAYFSPSRAFAASADGKAAQTKLSSLQAERTREIEARNKRLQSERAALQQAATVLDSSARLARETEIERFQIDLQRFTEDAQAEFLGVQKAVESAFLARLRPALDAVVKEKQLSLVLDEDAGLVLWADAALDITADVILRLNQP